MLKFNADAPEGLLGCKAPGLPSRLNDAHRAALAAVIESGPTPAVHGVVRWWLVDLRQWLWKKHHVTVAKRTLSRELRAMNYRKLSARPRHHALTTSYDNLVDHCCSAWNKPVDQPWTIMPIGLRDRAHGC